MVNKKKKWFTAAVLTGMMFASACGKKEKAPEVPDTVGTESVQEKENDVAVASSTPEQEKAGNTETGTPDAERAQEERNELSAESVTIMPDGTEIHSEDPAKASIAPSSSPAGKEDESGLPLEITEALSVNNDGTQDKNADLTAKYASLDEVFDITQTQQDDDLLGDIHNTETPEYLYWTDIFQDVLPSDLAGSILYNKKQNQNIVICALNVVDSAGYTAVFTKDADGYERLCRLNEASRIWEEGLVPDNYEQLDILSATTKGDKIDAIFGHSIKDLTDTRFIMMSFDESEDKSYGVWGIAPGSDYETALGIIRTKAGIIGSGCNVEEHDQDVILQYGDGNGTTADIAVTHSPEDKETVGNVVIRVQYELKLNG